MEHIITDQSGLPTNPEPGFSFNLNTYLVAPVRIDFRNSKASLMRGSFNQIT